MAIVTEKLGLGAMLSSISSRMTGLSLVAQRPEISPVSTQPVESLAMRSLFDLLLMERVPLADLPERDISAFVADLAYAIADLSAARRPRIALRLVQGADPWELGFERSGNDLLVSLVRTAATPEVVFHERRVDAEQLCNRLVLALDSLSTDRAAQSVRTISVPTDDLDTPQYGEAARNASARDYLRSRLPFVTENEATEPAFVSVEPTGDVPITIAADLLMRVPVPSMITETAVHRADLFSLLFRGRLRIIVGEHARELPEVFVFLVAEQLIDLVADALTASTMSRPYYRRLTVGGAVCAVRLQGEGHASLTIGMPRRGNEDRGQVWTFPAVDMTSLVQSVIAFARALSRTIVRRDRAQAQNLRLHAFRAKVRDLGERVRQSTRDESKINDAPEGYRAFAAATRPPPAAEDDSLATSRLRYTPRWLAAVPSIDLRATFLCGDAFVIGATRELSCLDRRTGEIVWTKPVPRATSVITPLGLARIEAEGALNLIDLQTGDELWTTNLSPRTGTSTSGVVVNTPGLPRMLVVSEGTRHLAAVDLHGGEIRWRYASRRNGVFRVRRAGKLLIVASGEQALTALDVLTGEVVWRVCDRRRFASHVSVDQESLFAVSGDGAFVERETARLHHVDPWSGASRWSVDLPAEVATVGAPLLARDTVVVVTHGRRGTGVIGFDRSTGDKRFEGVACTAAASCIVVDGTIILNSEGGELVGIDASDGSTRYRHVFGSADGDRPRRLEPLLRSGALFVPQTELFIVRPRDGKLLGRVPADLIPDLFRVDERADVYVAEESGHIAAFSAGPRLRLM